MAKDPAFLFYPGDWQGGTMYLTHEQKGCYMDLLILQFNAGKFTIAQAKQVLSICFDVAWPMLSLKFKTDGTYYWNERLQGEVEKRKRFTTSRQENAKGLKKKKHMLQHMEDENENILRIVKQLENTNQAPIEETQKQYFMYLVVEMAKIFTENNPEYPFDKNADYSACLCIAYMIAEQKKWTKTEILNGRMTDCLESWRKIVDFIKQDDWLKTRSLGDISTVREWQRLNQKMAAQKGSSGKKMVI